MVLTAFFHSLFFLAASFLSPAPDHARDTNKKKAPVKPITTIAFGSCNQEDLPQPLWADIITNKPQLWIWLGGNIDSETTDAAALKQKYQRLLAEPGYSALRESATILGIWDPHAQLLGRPGQRATLTTEDQQLFLDFMGAPQESPLRQQAGVYNAQTFGPKGKQVKVILLDTYSHRDSLLKEGQTYKPNPKGDLLGAAQWKWLEKELKQEDAELIIIGNATQVIPTEHAADKWANYPKCRERLFNLLARNVKTKGLILLSGGRHLAEISQLEVPGLEKPIFEVTSSGLTHSLGRDYRSEANRHRVGNVITKRNFGLVQIDWSTREATLKVHGDRNLAYLSQPIPF